MKSPNIFRASYAEIDFTEKDRRWNFEPWLERFIDALSEWTSEQPDIMRFLAHVPCGTTLIHFHRLYPHRETGRSYGGTGLADVFKRVVPRAEAEMDKWSSQYMEASTPESPLWIVLQKTCDERFFCDICRPNGVKLPRERQVPVGR